MQSVPARVSMPRSNPEKVLQLRRLGGSWRCGEEDLWARMQEQEDTRGLDMQWLSVTRHHWTGGVLVQVQVQVVMQAMQVPPPPQPCPFFIYKGACLRCPGELPRLAGAG